jgi:hypothetical protein
MQLAGPTLFLFIISCIIAATAISAIFIWIGTKFAGIRNATFGKAFYAALASSVAVWVLTGLARQYFGFGFIAGWLLGLGITLVILKSIYTVNWGKAFTIWIFTWIAQVIVGVIIFILIITGMFVTFFREFRFHEIVPGVTI